jgi:hypothetical protein
MDLPRRGLPAGNAEPPAGGGAPGLLGAALLACSADRAFGTLLVSGDPGGTIHLADGGVAAIDSPGAPGPDVVLLRSGRVSEPGWQDVFADAAAEGRMGVELVRRGLIGAGQLEVVLRAALADSMFALMSGHVDGCQLGPAATACLLPLEPPADPSWLLDEASRRLQVLASMPNRVQHDRDRVLRGHKAPPVGSSLDGGREGILALANGRRTARDMAFALGWGVYALTLEFSRMQEAGLLTIGSRRSVTRDRPRDPAQARGAALPDDSQTPGEAEERATDQLPALPRRRKPSGGAPRRSQPPAQQPGSSSALLRLLRPGSVTDSEPDGKQKTDERGR